LFFMVNVGKYTIHGFYGHGAFHFGGHETTLAQTGLKTPENSRLSGLNLFLSTLFLKSGKII